MDAGQLAQLPVGIPVQDITAGQDALPMGVERLAQLSVGLPVLETRPAGRTVAPQPVRRDARMLALQDAQALAGVVAPSAKTRAHQPV